MIIRVHNRAKTIILTILDPPFWYDYIVLTETDKRKAKKNSEPGARSCRRNGVPVSGLYKKEADVKKTNGQFPVKKSTGD